VKPIVVALEFFVVVTSCGYQALLPHTSQALEINQMLSKQSLLDNAEWFMLFIT
jgi:hypothetical protein